MLILKRKEGQWINILHKSGDLIRFRVYQICGGELAHAYFAFDDVARNFDVQRSERIARRLARAQRNDPAGA
jgi:hypothetical protein